MIQTKQFGDHMKALGFDFYTGVPCSFLNDLINYAINECDYVGAANEGDAIAIASGAHIGGRKPVVLMQNSGLTNAVSPLTSLNYTFKIPILGFVSLRGETGLIDEPQHELMGQITAQLLELMQVKWSYLSANLDEAVEQLKAAHTILESNEPYFFVVKKGSFSKEPLQERPVLAERKRTMPIISEKSNERLTRFEVLEVLNEAKHERTVLLATTGFTGRELYEVEDSEQNLYMVGSMGCVSSLGLGLALTCAKLDVMTIDGDGSLLMRMGSLATNAYYAPPNMLHLLLDNYCHDSTGGQQTVSAHMDFTAVAGGCGYSRVVTIYTKEQLLAELQQWQATPELTFIYLPIQKGAKANLSRPSVKPYEVKERLMRFINSIEGVSIG